MKRVNISYRDSRGCPNSKIVNIPVSDEEWYNNPGYYSKDALRDKLFMRYVPDAEVITSWCPA